MRLVTTRAALNAAFVLAVMLPLLLGHSANAHAELITSDPAAESRLTTAPELVTLEFTEPVETKFSIFKVYQLDAEVDMAAENAWQRLNGLAGALVSEVLTSRDDADAMARVDAGLTGAAARTDSVVIGLKSELPAGTYVVMWRVLSIDTHTTQGFAVFEYAPGGE